MTVEQRLLHGRPSDRARLPRRNVTETEEARRIACTRAGTVPEPGGPRAYSKDCALARDGRDVLYK